MSRRLRFKHHFRYKIVPEEGVFLLTESNYFLLNGPVYLRLAPLLDGRYSEDEIVELLHEDLPYQEIFYALYRLKSEGYITEVTSSTSMPAGQAAFWNMLGIDEQSASERLQQTAVSITSFGDIDSQPFEHVLKSLGISVSVSDSDSGQREIVLTDDYLNGELSAFNRESLAQNRSWMIVKPVGMVLWLGPILIPGQTGCWECLAHRLREHRKVERYLQEKSTSVSDTDQTAVSTSIAQLPVTRQTAFNLAASEIAKWIAGDGNEQFSGQMMTLDMKSLDKHHHVLVRRPQCPACGNPGIIAEQQFAPVELQRRRKAFTSDGGHRGFSPQQTVDALEHQISPITGIVGAIRRVYVDGDENRLTPSYLTDHNFTLVEQELYFSREHPRGRSGGKGKEDIQARASALSESIERYSGVYFGDEARVQARINDLEGAIHPNTCMRFSDRQYQQREHWNRQYSRFNWIPEPFDEQRLIEWSPVWSLSNERLRYVPMAYCYYGYSRQHNAWFARADANGCAAGNSLEEAILQGFMELVERDSVALWWYNRLRKPALDIASFEDPYIQELQDFYKKIHLDIWLIDITGDLNIPTFAAISRRNDSAQENIMFGFGTHLDPRIALLRAVTELNQLLPAVLAQTGNRSGDCEAVEWWRTAKLEQEPYLIPDDSVAAKVYGDYPKLYSDDLYTDIMYCVQLARENGLETLILDQTRPDSGLHAVRVIVPGLYHFWARFAPGRLYEVPVKMGWLDRPLSEQELNPKPMFL